MITAEWNDYEVIACGDGEKLERWGSVYLLRPDPQVIWPAPFPLASFEKLNAHYRRDGGGGRWEYIRPFPPEWQISWQDVKFLIKPMGFKHTGLFPEQAVNWQKTRALAEKKPGLKVLNLFGYTGGVTVALAKRGAFVTHVDAAKGMVERCRENAGISGVADDRIRYIIDDCKKFVTREIKRGKTKRTIGRNVEAGRRRVRPCQTYRNACPRSRIFPDQQLHHGASAASHQKHSRNSTCRPKRRRRCLRNRLAGNKNAQNSASLRLQRNLDKGLKLWKTN